MWIQQIEVAAAGKLFKNYGEERIEIDFDIPFSDKEEPDISEINLYNISDTSMNQVRDEGFILVNAGYRELGNMGNLLTGQVERVIPQWRGTDRIVKVIASDGAKSWRSAEFSKSYAAGTKASYIMRELANILGYDILDINPVEDKEFLRGYTVKGKASDSLKSLVKATKSKMFINKNRLVIRDKHDGMDLGFILNSDSGLIGSPEQEVREIEENGVKKTEVRYRVQCLLNPLLETDGIIEIDARELKGRFRIIEGRHTASFNTELLVEGV